eukprot:5405093-Pyramimonas_sp.AAC.2
MPLVFFTFASRFRGSRGSQHLKKVRARNACVFVFAPVRRWSSERLVAVPCRLHRAATCLRYSSLSRLGSEVPRRAWRRPLTDTPSALGQVAARLAAQSGERKVDRAAAKTVAATETAEELKVARDVHMLTGAKEASMFAYMNAGQVRGGTSHARGER